MTAAPQWWDAPSACGPLDSLVKLPGSKSQTNRALILGAIAAAPLTLQDPLMSRDSVLAARALEQLGATFTSAEPGQLTINPVKIPQLQGTIDCGLAGTVMRFVPAVAAFGTGTVTFDGDPQAYSRPVSPLLDALQQLGATVEYLGRPGRLPFRLTGLGAANEASTLPLRVQIDSSQSSQYLSALLLAAPLAAQSFTVMPAGATPSAAHIEMTVQMLEDVGVAVTHTHGGDYLVAAQRPTGTTLRIEPDLSNAGPFLAAPLITGGQVTVSDWPNETTQAGDAWRVILPQFGAQITQHGHDLRVSAPGRANDGWDGVDLDLGRVGELAPTVAALCLLAKTPSQLRGIGHLRGHETDRLAALVTQIRLAGGNATETADGIIIEPGPLQPTDFDSYHDHRMATFGALVGLAVAGCRVNNIETTAKTLPDFPQRWKAMLENQVPPPMPSLAGALGYESRQV